MAKAKKFRPFLTLLHSRIVDDVVAQGGDKEAAEKAVADLEGEHPILDLLKSLDWAAIIALILKLVAKPASVAPEGEPPA